MKTSAGPSPDFPASITRKETPSPTSTMCDDPVFDSAGARTAPRQLATIRQKKINLMDETDMAHSPFSRRSFPRKKSDILSKGSEPTTFREGSPDLPLSAARVKFCQRDRVSRLQCTRPSIRRCRGARVQCLSKSSSPPARRFHARSGRDVEQLQL